VSSEKSSWPGVSSRLKTWSPYSKVITEVTTEMPRSRSIFIQSERVWILSRLALTSPASWIAPPKSKQLLGQRRLAGVGVRDDRESAPPRHRAREGIGHVRQSFWNARAFSRRGPDVERGMGSLLPPALDPLVQFADDAAGGGLAQEGQDGVDERGAAGQKQARGEPQRESPYARNRIRPRSADGR
jgi:hypothetical protein